MTFVELGLEGENLDALLALSRRPGRPADTRSVAVWALELRQTGQSWGDIEKLLLAHRRQIPNPGQSIRREVQLLKLVLRRYGVEFEPSAGN
jgi:hypothetical protein